MMIRAQPLTQFPVAKSERLIDAAKTYLEREIVGLFGFLRAYA